MHARNSRTNYTSFTLIGGESAVACVKPPIRQPSVDRLYRRPRGDGSGAVSAADPGADLQNLQPSIPTLHRDRVSNNTNTFLKVDLRAGTTGSAGSAAHLHRTTTVVDWFDSRGKPHTAVAGPSLLDDELYLARPRRTGNRYARQRNYHGLTWVASTAAHVWHESLLERYSLLSVDFNSDIVAVASQPMKMTFPDGTEHYPDFIVLQSNYRQVVYDVKPAHKIRDKVRRQFENTAAACKAVGWGYQVLSDLDPTVRSNIEHLALFRQHYFSPSPGARSRLMDALTEPMTLREAAAAMRHELPNGALGALKHLAWTGELALDLTTPLSKQSLIRKAPSNAHP